MIDRWKKDPSDVLDYQVDWSKWLQAGETLVSRTVTPDTGITVDSSVLGVDKVTIWLSGGTIGNTYRIGCRVTTSQGRTAERSLRIQVEER
jgi:hypothetical protein